MKTMMTLAECLPVELSYGVNINNINKQRSPHIYRNRKTVKSIFLDLGPNMTKRAYRMTEDAFWELFDLLKSHIHYSSFRKNGTLISVKNGRITPSLRLSMALRYFAGGSPYDISQVHGVHYLEVLKSVWIVTNAINKCAELKIEFPADINSQSKLAEGFNQISKAGFKNIVGAHDGVLIWIDRPKKSECQKCFVEGPLKFYCARKGKYGLNMQACVDSNRRFLDVEISHFGSSSDYLAFTSSSLHHRLQQESLLHQDYIIVGDNAYVNEKFMATPYKSPSGSEDDYNYYHSQCRIVVECAFGMLVQRWGVLRKPISSTIGIRKVTAMVMALCRLHNFCCNNSILKNDNGKNDNNISAFLKQDAMNIARGGGVCMKRNESDELLPDDLLHGGEHFDDVSGQALNEIYRRNGRNKKKLDGVILPRDAMHYKVVTKGLRRPTPMQWLNT